MSFFNAIKKLFPRSKIFDLTYKSNLRNFIEGLSYLPDDIKTETEKVYLDLFPETTRALEEWENQFKVLFGAEQYGDTRQDILKALWRANKGGQTAEYLQDLLRKVNPQIYVTENNPPRSPTDANMAYENVCGNQIAVCGYEKNVCGYFIGNAGFMPGVIQNDVETEFNIPALTEYWEQCFFVSGEVVKNGNGEIIWIDIIEIEQKWKKFIEYLILKIKPVQMTALLFIKWI